ncbi:MAG: hypothetical protein IKO35_02315 [Elusimicrobiaceae bacterium]|nr:hypothetical protein [Elusimicrobiaceae bacterium]
MKVFSSRGSAILNIITILLVAVAMFVIFQPEYARKKMRRNFLAAVRAAEELYNAAQTYYIAHNAWPSAAADIHNRVDAKLISSWEISDGKYSCELAYGRGDKPINDIRCSPVGKYATVMFYQVILSESALNKRFCWAVKTNKEAKEMCQHIGGIFSHEVGGRAVPYAVYLIKQ